MRPLLALFGLLLGAGCTGPRRDAAAPRPSVLLVTLDTTRADRLGCYGFGLARTPNLDALARDGLRATRMIAAAPVTAPSHASMMTGLAPTAHGVRDNGSQRLAAEVETLAERFAAAGYDTGAFVSASVLDRRYDLDQGFEVYDDDLSAEDTPQLFLIRERPATRTIDRARTWIAARRGRPFFAWVHLFDAHQPRDPEPRDTPLAATPYDAEIAGLDRAVGELVAQVGEDTIVIVTADHGESLGEHGEETHAIFLYESTLHVPLLVRYPRALRAGTVYEGAVRGVDLAPTLLEAASLSPLPDIDGVSLWSAFEGRRPPPRLTQYSESLVSELGFGMAPLFALRDERYTYVRAPRPELYDRRTDPGELHDLSASDPERVRAMDAALAHEMAGSVGHARAPAESTLDEETIEQLRALGYVGDPGTTRATAGMDPKDGIAIHEAVDRARSLVREARHEEAERALQAVLAATPNNVSALDMLALVAVRTGRDEQARARYEASLGIEPEQPRVHLALAMLALDHDDLLEAERSVTRALAQSPRFVEALIVRGFVAARQGDDPTAQAFYARAIAIQPRSPRPHQLAADLWFERGDFERALAGYRRAIELAPNSFEALNQAGGAARRLGDAEGAFAYYARAERARPDSWIPPYNEACLHAVRGELELAKVALDRAFARGAPRSSVENDPDLAAVRAADGARR